MYAGLFVPAFFSINAFNLLNVSSFNEISSLKAESLKINLIGNGLSSDNLKINSSVISVSRQTLKYCYIIIRIFKIIKFVQLLQMLLFYY